MEDRSCEGIPSLVSVHILRPTTQGCLGRKDFCAPPFSLLQWPLSTWETSHLAPSSQTQGGTKQRGECGAGSVRSWEQVSWLSTRHQGKRRIPLWGFTVFYFKHKTRWSRCIPLTGLYGITNLTASWGKNKSLNESLIPHHHGTGSTHNMEDDSSWPREIFTSAHNNKPSAAKGKRSACWNWNSDPETPSHN